MLKILTFAAAASLAVSAQAVVVINGSFENGAAIPGGSLNVAANDTTTVTGWRALNANIDYVSSQVWDADHGRRSIDLAGTAAGGWRIIKTLGHKLVKLHPVHGFAAETASTTMIGIASSLGIPVSTTHNISAAIMGVGTAKRANAIKWSVVERMVWAWILTIPVAGGLAYLLVKLSHAVGWIPYG